MNGCILPSRSRTGGKSFHFIRLLFSILSLNRDSETGASFSSGSRPRNQNNCYCEEKADKASAAMLLTCLYLCNLETDVNYQTVQPQTENSLITAWAFVDCLLMLSVGSSMEISIYL